MRQVTSGFERRICSRSRRLKTIDHRSIHQQRMAAPLLDARAHPNTRFDSQICNSPPTSPVDDQIDCNGHNPHNFGPPSPQQQFMGSCKQKQSTNKSVSCNNMARSAHLKSTLSYFCQPDPLPDPCCRSITTLAIIISFLVNRAHTRQVLSILLSNHFVRERLLPKLKTRRIEC